MGSSLPTAQRLIGNKTSTRLFTQKTGHYPANRQNLAHILIASIRERPRNTAWKAACKALITAAGSKTVEQLQPSHITEAAELLTHNYATSTRTMNWGALRRILRWLWEEHGAQKLDGTVPRGAGIRPRNVVANRPLIDELLRKADGSLRLMILLCSDLAIRSGTAARLGPNHYDATTQTLHFTTKMGEKLTLPVTDEVKEMLDECDMFQNIPFVTQQYKIHPPTNPKRKHGSVLHPSTIGRRFKALLGTITPKRITLHDLRRTSAVRMYEQTGDLRRVQALLGHRCMPSTIWYLDHDLQPVSRSTLELIKQPPGPERKIA